jgi:hypothetical protein
MFVYVCFFVLIVCFSLAGRKDWFGRSGLGVPRALARHGRGVQENNELREKGRMIELMCG